MLSLLLYRFLFSFRFLFRFRFLFLFLLQFLFRIPDSGFRIPDSGFPLFQTSVPTTTLFPIALWVMTAFSEGTQYITASTSYHVYIGCADLTLTLLSREEFSSLKTAAEIRLHLLCFSMYLKEIQAVWK